MYRDRSPVSQVVTCGYYEKGLLLNSYISPLFDSCCANMLASL